MYFTIFNIHTIFAIYVNLSVILQISQKFENQIVCKDRKNMNNFRFKRHLSGSNKKHNSQSFKYSSMNLAFKINNAFKTYRGMTI